MIAKTRAVLWATAFFASSAAHAAENAWKGEITPYLWVVGIDGEATVGGRTVDLDVGFYDLFDAIDVGGSLLGVFQYRQVVFWTQIDYLSLSSDDLDDSPARGTLESDATISTLAVGYQFEGTQGETYDLLIGGRQLSLDNELRVDGIGTFEGDQDITDTVLMFRSNIPFSQAWRFDFPFSYGRGDSDATWELWPQFQYRFAGHWGTRLGYRWLYYDIAGDSRNQWNAAFHGPVIGFGGSW